MLAAYGGVAIGPQLDRLRRGVDIIVACPGRLGDLVRRNHVVLDAVEAVVIDEADRMADMGFLPEVRRLLDQVRPERQTLLFSATLDGDVDVFVRRYQRDPVRHDLQTKDIAHSNRHVFWKTEGGDRVSLLADVLRTHSPAIVFCRTKHGADRVTKRLLRLGVAATAIHGDRSQSQRSRALATFADGEVDALVATDVAREGSTSTRLPWSCTTTRPPVTRITSTDPAAPVEQGARAPSSRSSTAISTRVRWPCNGNSDSTSRSIMPTSTNSNRGVDAPRVRWLHGGIRRGSSISHAPRRIGLKREGREQGSDSTSRSASSHVGRHRKRICTFGKDMRTRVVGLVREDPRCIRQPERLIIEHLSAATRPTGCDATR